MRRAHRRGIAVLGAALLVAGMTGCGTSDTSVRTDDGSALTWEEAEEELDSLLTAVDAKTVSNPTLDIYTDEVSEADALADIDTFELTVEGKGAINIEIAAATEMSSDAPDDWLNIMAQKFNAEGYKIDSMSVSVSVRQITSGEVVTYMRNNAYSPNVFVPSNYAWGEMLEASGIAVTEVTDRLAGNTAGILIRQDVYDTFMEKYSEATMANVLEASLNGDLTFAYTNPYTSSTGLNVLAAMLKAFDEDNPLSSTASAKLMEYQQSSPPVAYTTAVLRNQAAKGVINAMVMEEQAYINTPELSDYVYIPVGIRHDHPVYTFDYDTAQENEAAQMFVDYCLTDEAQELAAAKGFNLHEDYAGEDPGLNGKGWLAAQSIWQENKNGGNPIITVFVADVSGSMDGSPLRSLKSALTSASSYISSDNYVGLVSYSGDVTIHLPIARFDAAQRAYFSGEVKSLIASGNTATYDAVLVAIRMLLEAADEVENAKLMLFVLSDGEQNSGYSLDRITPIVEGLEIPIYTISYNYSDDNDALQTLSNINEAAALSAESDDIMNQLRNLFNVSL